MIRVRLVCVLLFVLVLGVGFSSVSASGASVDTYIREALAANPGAQAAWFRVASARAALKQAR